MFIHIYSKDTFGFVENKLDNSDIEISINQYNDIVKNQLNGQYYIIKNSEATDLQDLFEIINLPEKDKHIIVQMQEDLCSLSNILITILEPIMLPVSDDSEKRELLLRLKEITDRYSIKEI